MTGKVICVDELLPVWLAGREAGPGHESSDWEKNDCSGKRKKKQESGEFYFLVTKCTMCGMVHLHSCSVVLMLTPRIIPSCIRD